MYVRLILEEKKLSLMISIQTKSDAIRLWYIAGYAEFANKIG